MQRASELRNAPTDAEGKLWAYLRLKRLKGVRFRRQHAIGHYVVDFCSPEARLIIEVDGSQHLRQQEQDAERTAYLESEGYRVLRFWNKDIMNDIEAVAGRILEVLEGT